MAVNHLVCCDGTNNAFGAHNTNVVRLLQSADRDPEKQRIYYDPGVGTLPDPFVLTPVGWLKAKVWKVADLAIGWGLESNVLEAYSYIMENWRVGDRVYLFGFSRGAYTVRVLAGLLHTLGLLPRGSSNLLPYVMSLFKSIRKQPGSAKNRYWKLCQQFRETFSLPLSPENRFSVRFLGVWDTVSSYGWLWNPASFPHTTQNPGCRVIRHAIAIDERRAFFRQNSFVGDEHQDLKELWFAGVHSDVGGGYPVDESGLWRVPFDWMVGEAAQHGLIVDSNRLREIHGDGKPAKGSFEAMHESLTPRWWAAEFVPKFGHSLRINLFKPRYIPDGARMHRATLLRLRENTEYRPRNVSSAFVAHVCGLSEVPDTLEYRWRPSIRNATSPGGTHSK